MKHLVDRQYLLSVIETKQAIADYLKKLNKPFPADISKLQLDWNGPGEFTVKYCEQVE